MNEDKKKRDSHDESENVVKGIYHTYRAEFRKIVWPSRETLIKHTVTVIAVSLMFGAYIALIDGGYGWLFGRFVDLVS